MFLGREDDRILRRPNALFSNPKFALAPCDYVTGRFG
jgi:hypothetical protein